MTLQPVILQIDDQPPIIEFTDDPYPSSVNVMCEICGTVHRRIARYTFEIPALWCRWRFTYERCPSCTHIALRENPNVPNARQV